jgi:DNA polymerase III subunit gamma/tau
VGGGGEDERRRPVPPSVTPDDARTPVLDPTPPVDADEEAEVREAEDDATSTPDLEDVDQLLSTELDAELVDEEPPPGRESA